MSRSHAQSQEDLIKLLRDQMEQQQQQMQALLALVHQQKPGVSNTKFDEFDPSAELWSDYWCRFETFLKANAIPDGRRAEIFLTNQSSTIYKLVMNMAQQQTPPKDINSLSMEEIEAHMADQYSPKRFVVRERFKFWTNTDRKSGETVHELAARIRQEAATCDFAAIKDPLDEAMRTRFVCSIKSEATIKALFKIKDDELTFNRAIEIAAEVEEASKVAKETLGCGCTVQPSLTAEISPGHPTGASSGTHTISPD
ncbi:transposon Tf2-6 polyprotein [Elysia marginata]|uniref:Transposon Tf2-6 polyprotein n=1 Tax=Elysia marginata TaxID=1093978 RepID=A0AAV4HJ83_9GAST|nr:transposon Tf2-6 polyprotein [Elysia marginata]